jgi:hypothetical protein
MCRPEESFAIPAGFFWSSSPLASILIGGNHIGSATTKPYLRFKIIVKHYFARGKMAFDMHLKWALEADQATGGDGGSAKVN